MSYCRFSCDNWKSDIYAYESERGYEIHVAGNRHVGDIPPLLEWSEENHEQWFARYQEQMGAIRNATITPIGLPFDGESFTYGDLEDFYDALLELRAVGYHVPDHAIDAVDDEMATAVRETS